MLPILAAWSATPGVIIVLFCLGLGLIGAELFVPGGILGAIGFLILCVCYYFSFSQGHTALGVGLILVSIIGIPIIILKGLKRMSLKTKQTAAAGFSSSREGIQELLGKQGVTLSSLRPSGTARIDNRKHSVVTRGEMIGAQTRIEVVEVEGNRVVVQAVKVR